MGDQKKTATKAKKEEKKEEVVQQIKKAILNKSGLNIEYNEAILVEGKAAFVTTNVNNPDAPHPDLLQALKLLLPHFILIAELPGFDHINESYIKGRKILEAADDADIFKFQVNGVVFSGDQDKDGQVQLIGRLIKSNGKVISMTLPIEALKHEGGYPHKTLLAEDINNFIDEADKFHFQKKRYQMQLEFANGNDER